MKIALIHASDDGHGAERCVMDLHRSLMAAGHESTLFVGLASTGEAGVRGIVHPRVLPGLRRLAFHLDRDCGLQTLYSPGLRRLAAGLDVDTDVVHIHTLWGGQNYGDLESVRRLAQRFPVVMTLHEQWLTTGHCACPFECQRWRTGCGRCPDLGRTPRVARDVTRLNWWRKRLLFRGSRVHLVAVSRWLLGVVQQSPILGHLPAEVIYNGMDDSVFLPSDRQKDFRAGFGIPAQSTVVLLAGQTVEGVREGRAQHAVEALNRLAGNGDLFVLAVGSSAPAVTARLAVPSRALPFQATPAAMARCYQAADFTVVTSEYETFGRIAAESQFCGLPVVTFATGGLPEVIEDRATGYVVPTGDIDRLTTAVASVLRMGRDERGAMGQRGRVRAVRMFSNATIGRQHAELYARLCAEGGRR